MFKNLLLSEIVGVPEASQVKALFAALVNELKDNGPGLLNAQSTSVSHTAATAEETFHSFTLPANFLAGIGTNSGLRITAFGLMGASADDKTIKLYFGTAVVSTGAVAGNAVNWWLELIVLRSGVSTQMVLGKAQYSTTMITPYFVAATEDETAAITIKSTGTQEVATLGDSIAKGFLVEVIQ